MAVSQSPKKSIGINHPTGTITINDDTYIKINENGAVLIGDNSNLLESIKEGTQESKKYAGLMVYNKSSNRLQYYDGEQWQTLAISTDNADGSICWSLIF